MNDWPGTPEEYAALLYQYPIKRIKVIGRGSLIKSAMVPCHVNPLSPAPDRAWVYVFRRDLPEDLQDYICGDREYTFWLAPRSEIFDDER